MMMSLILRLLATVAIVSRLVASGPVIGLCTEGTCKDCPRKIEIQEGLDEYPFCSMWDSTKMFGNHSDFKLAKEGGYEPFFNIPAPKLGCRFIIRKATDTGITACGIPIASFSQPICYPLPLPTLFMIQQCCDPHECLKSAQSQELPKQRRALGQQPMDVSDVFCDKHGRLTRTAPFANPVKLSKQPVYGRVSAAWQWQKLNLTDWPRQPGVKDGCHDKGSWRVIRRYKKPSSLTSVVSERVDGSRSGAQVQISVARSDTWSSSITMKANLKMGWNRKRGLGMPGGGLDLGMDLSQGHTCSITDTKVFWIGVDAYRSGRMVFTGFQSCEIGTYTCKGRVVGPHELCFPIKLGTQQEGVYNILTGN